MLYHLLDPPLLFSSHGGETTRPTDYRKWTHYRCLADHRGFEVLICSSPRTSEEGRMGGGGVGVIRWFQSWKDPGERNESLTLPRAGFHADAEHT